MKRNEKKWLIALPLKKLWPQKLLGQMIFWVVMALLLAQGINLWLLSRAHEIAVLQISERYVVRQFTSAVELIAQTPSELHPSILRAWQRPGASYRLKNEPPAIAFEKNDYAEQLQQQIQNRIGDDYAGRIYVVVQEAPNSMGKEDRPHKSAERDNRELGSRYSRLMDRNQYERRWWKAPPPRLRELLLAVQLDSGQWLLSRQSTVDLAPLAARTTFLFMVLALVLLLAVVYWQLRRITRPLRFLSIAADEFGRGKKRQPVVEEGPEDIRHTVRAFNRMHDRIDRFVADRTRLLAALSHDLRTPLTSMRLRLELMADSEEKDKLLLSLDEMQKMSEATLSFVRESGDRESTQAVDVSALLGSLCEDLQDVGMSVEWQEAEQLILEIRPVSLKRALRNLIENAVFYGDNAKVSMSELDESVRIRIADDGPGIPEDKLAFVLEPFQRAEQSRNRATGGMGLGLSIARQIVMSHGGALHLQNAPTGLVVDVFLPRHG